MENTTRTVYGSYLQTCMLTGVPFSKIANTTLNEKFSIQADAVPNAGEIPKMRYFAIGNGGHQFTVGADGVAKPEPVQHRATDAALFKHLPFVLREPTNDLAAADRANYGLRREETWNGLRYIAYYLKRIPMADVVPGMEYKTVADGTTTTTAFVPDSSNLNPTPPDLSSTGVNVVSGDYTVATAKVGLSLSATDVTELLNVAQVIFGDPNAAIISEIAMVAALDRSVQVAGVGGAMFAFNEAVVAQVVSHINSFFPLRFSNNGVELLLDVGATEPLFALS